MKMDEMTQEQAWELWHQRLESEDIEKHKGALADPENPDRRCCLGHLCGVLEIPHSGEDYVEIAFENHLYGLPRPVQKLLNVTSEVLFVNPVWIDDERMETITDINDSKLDIPLSEISNILRRERERGNLVAAYDRKTQDPNWE